MIWHSFNCPSLPKTRVSIFCQNIHFLPASWSFSLPIVVFRVHYFLYSPPFFRHLHTLSGISSCALYAIIFTFNILFSQHFQIHFCEFQNLVSLVVGMDSQDFRQAGKRMVDYVADYWDELRTGQRRPLPPVKPGYLDELVRIIFVSLVDFSFRCRKPQRNPTDGTEFSRISSR